MARRGRTPLTTLVFFGLLIALVLIGSQVLALWWWPVRGYDAYAATIGALFLAAGIAVGWRARSGRRRDLPDGAEAAGRGAPTAEASLPPLYEPLTPREREILASLAAGHSNSEIAAKHSVSLNTVKTHLRQLYGKLQVSRRVQAVGRARRMGLLD